MASGLSSPNRFNCKDQMWVTVKKEKRKRVEQVIGE